MYKYFIGCLLFGLLWFFLYFLRKDLRVKIIFSSLLALPLGFTETFFVPEYWNPEVLFKFTVFGFSLDLESFLFCFFIGGVSAAGYELLFARHLRKMRSATEQKYHALLLFIFIVVMPSLLAAIFFRERLIYSAIFFMFLGAGAMIFVRRDLFPEVIWGSLIFFGVYSVGFIIFNLFFDGWIASTWNTENLIGISIFNIPLEEYLFALSFGALWAPLYEELFGYRIR